MRPTRLLVYLSGALVLLVLFVPWQVPFLLLAGLAVLDLALGRADSAVKVRRIVAHNLPVNRPSRIHIELENESRRPLQITAHDETPTDSESEGLPAAVALGRGAAARVTYRLQPERRGDMRFGNVVLMITSPLKLWQVKSRHAIESDVRVYPDFAVISEYLDLVSDRHVSRLGVRLTPRRGEGLEFHQLREYREGDAIRQVDWKATARRRQLISREYQEERDQRVLFLLDTGRRMRSRDDLLSHFDHSLNAMLLLAYVALRQGDSVGLRAFGSVRKAVPALTGVAAVNQLLNEVYDLDSGPEASDYIGVAEEVMASDRKRSLVVLMTNLRETDADLVPAVRLMRQRHVVLVANLRERSIDEVASGTAGTFSDALTVAGAHTYLARRQRLQRSVSAAAHVLLDCAPQELPIRVVNSYWRLKRSGEL